MRRRAEGIAFGQSFRGPAAHDQQRVAEPLGRQQSGFWTCAGNQRVVGHGAGVEKKLGRAQELVFTAKAEIARRIAHRVERAHGKVIGSRQRLAQSDRAIFIHCHAVGKRSADIDTHDVFHDVAMNACTILAARNSKQ